MGVRGRDQSARAFDMGEVRKIARGERLGLVDGGRGFSKKLLNVSTFLCHIYDMCMPCVHKDFDICLISAMYTHTYNLIQI